MNNDPKTHGPVKQQPYNRAFFIPGEPRTNIYLLVGYPDTKLVNSVQLMKIKDSHGATKWIDWETIVESL